MDVHPLHQASDPAAAAIVHLAYSGRTSEQDRLIAQIAQEALMGAEETVRRALSELAGAITAINEPGGSDAIHDAEYSLLRAWRGLETAPGIRT
jgi:dsDNA-specific endonuclease/ATPase MutS2